MTLFLYLLIPILSRWIAFSAIRLDTTFVMRDITVGNAVNAIIGIVSTRIVVKSVIVKGADLGYNLNFRKCSLEFQSFANLRKRSLSILYSTLTY